MGAGPGGAKVGALCYDGNAMRCPNCAGEIPAGSRFCGICGRNITVAPLAEALGDASAGGRWPAAAARPDPAQPAMSLFELPVSRGARTAKLALVLVLDAILAGAGIVMILSYLDARRGSERPAERPVPARTGAVKVGAPKAVAPPPTEAQPAREIQKQDTGNRTQDTGNRTQDTGNREPAENRQPKAAPIATATPARPTGAAASAPEAEAVAADPAAEEDGGEVDRLTAELTAAVARRAGDLERCYQRAAKVSGPSDPLEGTIDVHVTVMPDGSARDVRAGENTTGSAQLADCAVTLFRSVTVAAGAASPVDLVWPLQFRPPDK